VAWFCSIQGHEFFCEVPSEWIEDGFNLYGLRQEVGQLYDRALDLILDRRRTPESASTTSSPIAEQDLMLASFVLYGLIHARYIVCSAGLEAMLRKYTMAEFGWCPRYFCQRQPVVPLGLSDRLRQEVVKIYCPRCRQVYDPPVMPGQAAVDGAYFGTTFPHLLFMTYEVLLPEPTESNLVFVPRIFGFRVHRSSPLVAQAEQPSHRGSASIATPPASRQPPVPPAEERSEAYQTQAQPPGSATRPPAWTDHGRRLRPDAAATAAATAAAAVAADTHREVADDRGYLASSGTVQAAKEVGVSTGKGNGDNDPNYEATATGALRGLETSLAAPTTQGQGPAHGAENNGRHSESPAAGSSGGGGAEGSMEDRPVHEDSGATGDAPSATDVPLAPPAKRRKANGPE